MARTRRPPTHVSDLRATTRRVAMYVACASIPAVIGTGCFVGSFSPIDHDLDLLVGNDSAGAEIQIANWGDDLATARVTDIVLGTAEAEVARGSKQLSFTILFPAGVAITYTADVPDSGRTIPDVIEGTWIQHAGGIFGQDAGTWSVERRSPSES